MDSMNLPVTYRRWTVIERKMRESNPGIRRYSGISLDQDRIVGRATHLPFCRPTGSSVRSASRSRIRNEVPCLLSF
jgi:hypothetical protein